jgi:hypothetical protein
MPAVVKATHALGRPGNDVRYAGCHLLLAARAPEGPVRAVARDPLNEPFAVAVGLSAFDPTEGTVQIELRVVSATAMGSGHAPIVAGQRRREHQAVRT